MDDPLDEVLFLARSGNRIEALRRLSERPSTRGDLCSALDVSQPTMGRILRALEERNWVVREGKRYRATPTGRLVAAGIADLLDRLETESRLRDVVEWLPADDLEFDLRRLADATITTPTTTRPNAPISRMVELLRDTDRALFLSHAFNEAKLDLLRERSETLVARGVFSEAAIEPVVADPTLRRRLREALSGDGIEIRVTDESVPVAVEVTDDRTHLLLRDGDGVVRTSLDTNDDAVRAWAESIHERYWTDARPLAVDDVR